MSVSRAQTGAREGVGCRLPTSEGRVLEKCAPWGFDIKAEGPGSGGQVVEGRELGWFEKERRAC
jgi:hypothetical protein